MKLGYQKNTGINKNLGMSHFPFNASFFSFTGDGATPAMTIRLDNYSGIRKAYEKCSPVSTIVNRLASSMANGKIWILTRITITMM